jgi:Putative MetA-pathway of phenol degradation
MGAKLSHGRRGRWYRWLTQAVVVAACWAGAAAAQTAPVIMDDGNRALAAPVTTSEGGVVPAGCSHCGVGSDLPPLPIVGGGGCVDGCCVPGRTCDPCCGGGCGCFGRLLCGLNECLCCPDPCYEPHWIPVADSAFFVDAARPQTQMRFRWDNAFDFKNPDRAEFFWARFGQKGPSNVSRRFDYSELSLYMEGAAGGFGFFINSPYREIDPEPAFFELGKQFPEVSGFADIDVGTKSLLLDCELLQVAFQFRVYIPTGDFHKGLGTGHTSLEPSILFTLKLSPRTYLQGQLSYWIPIAGDNEFEGNVFHCHFSLNRELWHITPNLLLVGTAEVNEWTPINGEYTSTDFQIGGKNVGIGAAAAMVSAGPGLRLFICDKIDVGVGTAFAFTGDRWAEEMIRAEFRWRF